MKKFTRPLNDTHEHFMVIYVPIKIIQHYQDDTFIKYCSYVFLSVKKIIVYHLHLSKISEYVQ